MLLLPVLASLHLGVAPASLDAPYMIAKANVGLDLNDDSQIDKTSHARTGHGTYTQAELTREKSKLPPNEQAAYAVIRKTLAGQKLVLDQLDALVAKHRVSYVDIKGQTILDNLRTIATARPTHGIPAAVLLRDTLQDLCRPSTIDQAAHGTCTATSIQAALARRNPGEYARLVAGLGTGSGTVTAHDGQHVLSSADYIAFRDRTASSNLMQPAIMELEAQVEGAHYHNKIDKMVNPRTGQSHGGANLEDVSVIESALVGGHYTSLAATPQSKPKLMAMLEQATSKDPVLAAVETASGGGHEIQVVGFDAGTHAVLLRNPWGQLDRVPEAKFSKALYGISYREGN